MATQFAELEERLELFHFSLRYEPFIMRRYRHRLVGETYDRLIEETQDPDTKAALLYNREAFFAKYVS